MNQRSRLPIGVFDSGLGGLTVVKEIVKKLPRENIIYVGDTARVPYGTKSPETITRYGQEIARFLLKKRVKAIVVACNSVSAVALNSFRNYRVPVLGVIEPGARAAHNHSTSKRVGVIGTPATMTSHAYKRAIRRYDKKVLIWEKPCPLFVPLVEEGWYSHPITKGVAKEYLRSLLRNGIDTLVLGCTHYPLLKKLLRTVVGRGVKLIDSAEETAKDLKNLLFGSGLLNNGRRRGKIEFFVTDHPHSFTKMAQQFLGNRGQKAKRLSLDGL